MIEQIRYTLKPKLLTNFFALYCDEREQNSDLPIVTHLYLIIGCGLPITLSFILFKGGFFNGEFATLSLSGVVFLGVGDVAAALYGKNHGTVFW